MNERVDPLRLRAERMVQEGLTDRQIDQEIMYSDHADRLVIWEHVNELRGGQASRPLTTYQAEKIPILEAEAARLTRTSQRGASDAALSRHTGVDRGTIAAWRKAGILKA